MADKPLQTQPTGLLGAMGMKVGGQNPDMYGQAVRPSMDVFPFYMVGKTLIGSQLSGAIAIGATTAVVSVKSSVTGTLWRVHGLSVGVDLDTADVGIYSGTVLEIWDQSSIAQTVLAEYQVATGLKQRRSGLFLPEPFLLPLGWSLEARIFFSAPLTVATEAVLRWTYEPIDS